MGCDIHSVIQGQWLDADKPDETCWHTVAEGFYQRNYVLFSFLAGVRSDGNYQLVPKRGLPKDFLLLDDAIHPLPIDFQFRSDGFAKPDHHSSWVKDMGEHSFSWLTWNEFENGAVDCPDDARDEYHHVLSIFRGVRIRYSGYKNWRIVFGFDN